MTIKVLVVEDDLANQQVALLFLKRFGYQAIIAENGAVAVENCKETKYPIIFMDCQMPVMDGFTASLAIRENQGPNQFTPIIALTANSLIGIKKECISAGMDDILSKPISLDRLNEMTEKWIGKSCSHLNENLR